MRDKNYVALCRAAKNGRATSSSANPRSKNPRKSLLRRCRSHCYVEKPSVHSPAEEQSAVFRVFRIFRCCSSAFFGATTILCEGVIHHRVTLQISNYLFSTM